MPKKMGTNSKAVEARARKDEKKRSEQERIQKEKEDAYWKDDDKQLMKKQQKKAEADKKKEEAAAKKALKQALYDEEMASIKGPSGGGGGGATKVTRAQIATRLEVQKTEKPKPKLIETPIEENLNRIVFEGEARTVDEAISILSLKDPELDRHPERRVKASFTAFEEKMLPRLKAENPNLRLSQLKQMLKKDWMKSPENPLNQPHTAYNSSGPNN